MANEHPRESEPISDLNFRPLNPGLGLHKNAREGPIRPGSLFYPREERRQRQQYLRDQVGHTHRIESPTPVSKEASIPKKQSAQDPPPLHLQLAAYLTDVAIVSLTTGLTLGFFSIILLGKLDYRPFLEGIFQGQMATGFLLLYGLYYMAYFTLMETSCTVGKEFFGIETLETSGARPSLYRSFLRSLVALLSIFALFLPLLFKLQDKISQTQVGRR